MNKIHLHPIHNAGFGNLLYQLFAAIDFAKTNNVDVSIHGFNEVNDQYKFLFNNIDKDDKVNSFIYTTDFNKYLPLPVNKIFCAYCQNLKYIEHLTIDEMLNVINIKPKHTKCVVHVRGGDYFKNGNENIYYKLNKEYYIKALNLLNVDIKDAIIITNDSYYAKQLLGDDINISNNYFIDDFRLLCGADNIVLANSTFSIWGAYLNKTANVIYSDKYYTDDFIKKNNVSYLNIYKPNWTKVDI